MTLCHSVTKRGRILEIQFVWLDVLMIYQVLKLIGVCFDLIYFVMTLCIMSLFECFQVDKFHSRTKTGLLVV
jgi:hypothetical protein